jgi:hypothetical protein
LDVGFRSSTQPKDSRGFYFVGFVYFVARFFLRGIG